MNSHLQFKQIKKTWHSFLWYQWLMYEV